MSGITNFKNLVFSREKVCFKKNEVIFHDQDEGHEMYFIDSGRVQIMKKIVETLARRLEETDTNLSRYYQRVLRLSKVFKIF